MHILFIPYGKRSEVELLLRDMESQKHKLPMWKGKKKKEIYIQGQIRLLPFGVYEYVCPKQDADIVLTTLKFDRDRYQLGWKLNLVKKLIKCEHYPTFENSTKYLWIMDNVNIIPLGIRQDPEYTDEDGEHKGWTHEAI